MSMVTERCLHSAGTPESKCPAAREPQGIGRGRCDVLGACYSTTTVKSKVCDGGLSFSQGRW